jgi:hypothetical protein
MLHSFPTRRSSDLQRSTAHGLEPSSFSPLDLITVVKVIAVGATVAMMGVGVRTLIRRRAAKALAQASKRELTSGSGETVAKSAATFTRRVGKLSAEEMEQYLKQVLAARSDLRRLMAARGTKGPAREEAIKTALREFEDTQRWKVFWKTRAEMKAVTTESNLVHMRNDARELWVNSERAEGLYEHTVHDLAAHALAGKGGSLGPSDLPFVGVEFRKGITDGLSILERSIMNEGGTDWITRFFGSARAGAR